MLLDQIRLERCKLDEAEAMVEVGLWEGGRAEPNPFMPPPQLLVERGEEHELAVWREPSHQRVQEEGPDPSILPILDLMVPRTNNITTEWWSQPVRC